MTERLAVGTLAEFVHRRGDLHVRLDGRTRAEEGIKVQRKLQRGMPDTYQRERAVSLEHEIAERRYIIGGRIDGCDVEGRLLEEYKTTRADAGLAHAHLGNTHWAQIQLYGALLVHELLAGELPTGDGAGVLGPWTLRLLYCHPDTLATRTFERSLSSTELVRFLDETLSWLSAWLQVQRDHEVARDSVLQNLDFPHSEYRPHQHALARRAYRALRDREHLLLEAPTGSGKTIGLLYPAVKALATTDHEKVFFLTSRNTGAAAAVASCEQLDTRHEYLRYVQIVNKERACLVEGMPCDPQRCQYANGYYDRVHDAVGELLQLRAMGPEQVRTVAETHQVCPFELSLDAALWADVLIGDYNYVFDPIVHLQRFAQSPNIALLVDESHQLSSRARDMLSLTLSRNVVRLALQEAQNASLPSALLGRIRSIDRNLLALKRRHSMGRDSMGKDSMGNGSMGKEQSVDHVVPAPQALLRAIARFVEELAGTEILLDAYPRTRTLTLDCFRWVRAEAWYDEARCVYIAEAAPREFTLKRVHLDPGPYLQQVLGGFGAHIRFSGTVSPMPLYQKLHGMQAGPIERAGSPFSAGQLDVLIVDDVPTYWRSRERSLGKLIALIGDVVSAQAGNYLVALPSFEYLRCVAGALSGEYPHLNVVAQTPGMTPAERADFVGCLQDASAQAVGLVVMGGVFAESVDFSALGGGGSTLVGVICVGIGLPPPGLERTQLEAYFSAQGDDGHAVAFQQPAMTKILQIAGRLLRDPGDRGVLCLVDARFKDRAYQRFFPAHWQPRIVTAAAVAARLDKFWRGRVGSPRLRA